MKQGSSFQCAVSQISTSSNEHSAIILKQTHRLILRGELCTHVHMGLIKVNRNTFLSKEDKSRLSTLAPK